MTKGGAMMRGASKFLFLIGLIVVNATIASGAGVTGTVKGPDGTPFMGAFVQARNAKMKMTVSVLSDGSGRYRIENLPAGDYELRIRAAGYQAEPRRGVSLTANQNASYDFALRNGMVRWSDLSYDQAVELFPAAPGKAKLMSRCFVCHGFQSRMASVIRDEEGWRDRVEYMRTAMGVRGPRFTDQDSENVIAYLNSLFGQNSVLPRSPTEMPAWKSVAPPPVTEDMTKIVYVEYEAGKDRMPFSGTPDQNGIVWIPMAGNANRLGRLDPMTGEIQEFPIPIQDKTAQVHSASPAADGSVWIAESSLGQLGKWDPKTRTITDYENPGGGSHTVRLDQSGTPWSTPGPSNRLITRFDMETGKFTKFPGTEQAYGLIFDKDGNCWFVQYVKDGELGKIDAKTGKVSKWEIPSPDARPRRIDVDADGMIWFAEFQSGKIGRFDPKTETFQEWTLPGSKPAPYPDDENGPYAIGSSPGPYAFALDKKNNAWYSGNNNDRIGRLDPKTGKVTEYPFPHAEITMREFFLDAQGHMWYGSSANDRVGYFYLTE
jgi:virginiamycin B lyase